MKAYTVFYAVLGLFLLVNFTQADLSAPPIPYVRASQQGRFFFKMVPAKSTRTGYRQGVEGEAFGVAYSVEKNGSFKERWKTSGWYSRTVFLSNDGKYLVRIERFGLGQEPTKDCLAIAFYNKGKLLKEYTTSDLVKDKSKVIKTVSHYMWLARENGILRLDSQNVFHLKTIDGIIYQFDVTTGERSN
ncbi:MAG: hypothetical protein ACYTE8_02225 [Planctomycetota bacterium]